LVAAGVDHIASAMENLPAGTNAASAQKILEGQEHAVYDRRLPNLTVDFGDRDEILDRVAPQTREFTGLLQQRNGLYLLGIREVPTPNGPRVVRVQVPVTPDFIATLAPDLGQVEFDLLEPVTAGDPNLVIYALGNTDYKTSKNITGRHRSLHPARGRWDLK